MLKMSGWKLVRQSCEKDEEYSLPKGEIKIGRGLESDITLFGVVVSRRHCVLNVEDNKITLEDLYSSNGTYLRQSKLCPHKPTPIYDNDIIKIGCVEGVEPSSILFESFIFKLVRESPNPNQPNPVFINIKADNEECSNRNPKRKLSLPTEEKKVNDCLPIIDLANDSDNDEEWQSKNKKIKIKLESNVVNEVPVKTEEAELQSDAFIVKQEYFDYNEEPILIDSESDSENDLWFSRLSQSSPGKPLVNHNLKPEPVVEPNNISESVDYDDAVYSDDIIEIPAEPLIDNSGTNTCQKTTESLLEKDKIYSQDIIQIPAEPLIDNSGTSTCQKTTEILFEKEKIRSPTKRTIQIEPRKKTKTSHVKDDHKKSSRGKSKHKSSHTDKSKHLSSEQRENRRKKLKEIASEAKEKPVEGNCSKVVDNSDTVKPTAVAKVTLKNRGAFLIETALPMKPKSKHEKNKDNKNKPSQSKENNQQQHKKSTAKINNIEKGNEVVTETNEVMKSVAFSTAPSDVLNQQQQEKSTEKMHNIDERKEIVIKTNKLKKSVTFSTEPPEVNIYYIEPGNELKKTSSVKSALLDVRLKPSLPTAQIYLKKILKWNPHWLNEQLSSKGPPPITDYAPQCLLHSFDSHKQYVQLVGDLLLIEIWECITQAYLRKRNHVELKMRLISAPLVPSPDRCFDYCNLATEVTIPKSEIKVSLPTVTELMVINFGPEDNKCINFFYVQSIKKSNFQANGQFATFIVNLQATTTNVSILKEGDILLGKKITMLKNELLLFEALDHLALSPLCKAILKPHPKLFPNVFNTKIHSEIRQHPCNSNLNSSQLQAVEKSVTIALEDKPAIQMIQGPPGTGKSAVICSIVMCYIYDTFNRKVQNRGKVLICASSNAAIDEIVIRLLDKRQALSTDARFRMVRVGRLEAMHDRARSVSSDTLAQRDIRRHVAVPSHEVHHLQAKINMTQSTLKETKDEGRIAYCKSRLEYYQQKLSRLCGKNRADEMSSDQLQNLERYIIERADIILTTLSSAANPKMRGLRGNIALCIVDEAGQAIEPETLIPLTLDVTRLILVGDTQQLPGYICSQRAKSLGLSESLFARLSSFAEQWKDTTAMTFLNTQYRMHPSIASYPDRTFYGGQIIDSVEIRDDLGFPHYALVSIYNDDKMQDNSGTNRMEAWGVSKLAVAIQKITNEKNLSLAIITPYKTQKDLIKKILVDLLEPNDQAGIEVNTVDSFQGQERDVILVSLARSSGAGFLIDTGRINVMLTRAKHSLIVCLNPKALSVNAQWKTLVDDAKRRGFYRTLPKEACRPARGRDDRVLRYLNAE